MIVIGGLKFYIEASVLNRWCNEYGYKDVQDLNTSNDIEVIYKIYCNTVGFFKRDIMGGKNE